MRLTILRRSTVAGLSSVILALAPLALGSRSSTTRVKRMRMGTATASPKAMASPLPIEEMKLVVDADEFGDRRADDILVAVVGQPHGKDGRALGQDRRIKFAGALGDDAERNAVFAAFLGDTGNGLAGRQETEALVGRHIAVRFLADDKHVYAAIAPQADFKGHAAENRRDRVDDFGRNAGQLERGDRSAFARYAENFGDGLDDRVGDRV